MRSIILRISLLVAFLCSMFIVRVLPTRSDNRVDHGSQPLQEIRKHAQGRGPLSYRSPGSIHKLSLPARDFAPSELSNIKGRSADLLLRAKTRKYGSHYVVQLSDEELSALDDRTLEAAQLRDDMNLILLRSGQIDTTGPEPPIDNRLRQRATSAPSLELVQLFGPPTSNSFHSIEATGSKVVSYVPNTA